MLHVRRVTPHSHHAIFRTLRPAFSIVLPKIPEKPRVVRQFYATAEKKCNTFVKFV
jgi:hypothetical protein